MPSLAMKLLERIRPIVISILGDIADDLHHFICVTVLDQR